ncbi:MULTISPECIES: YrhK family protein [Aerococcus]|uniref:YrhK family protein n=1 Tax=Aerococcus TaxID=1375 RepID=UPI000DCB343D|nr:MULTISPECIES: YrhK family protein [Aerococcus]KAA9232100.1 hypothetical protein F6I37_08160 [Aerococcus mictus]MDK6375458.1 YrhK family protein [Aerococcus urinae]MDK6420925.1 YrhK family protein [Aerococcus urinae]MDK8075799.1 YrhK family protein [Aerococcus urinae]MDK8084432.1 YrhK family protein [Aerococcus urinae]
MAKLKRKTYEENSEAEDIVVKIGPLRLYFQNVYTIISLINDIFTGSLYFIGSICNFFGAPAIYGNTLYLIGGFSFVMRPIIKLIHNIHIYKQDKVKRQRDEARMNPEKVFQVHRSQASPEQDGDYLGDAYNHEYYEDDDYQSHKKKPLSHGEGCNRSGIR